MLVLSYFNIRNLRNADIADEVYKCYEPRSDVIQVVHHERG